MIEYIIEKNIVDYASKKFDNNNISKNNNPSKFGFEK